MVGGGGTVANTIASQQEGLVFDSRAGQALSNWSLLVLPVHGGVFSGYSG